MFGGKPACVSSLLLCPLMESEFCQNFYFLSSWRGFPPNKRVRGGPLLLLSVHLSFLQVDSLPPQPIYAFHYYGIPSGWFWFIICANKTGNRSSLQTMWYSKSSKLVATLCRSRHIYYTCVCSASRWWGRFVSLRLAAELSRLYVNGFLTVILS